jgi:tRNA U38,U39,U40 pseudouridine synthase TruA
MTPDQVGELLRQGAGRTRGINAPAHGLTLWKVSYSNKQRGF